MWNIIRKIKYFFYKLKIDLGSLLSYPDINLFENFKVDYDKYWQQRRGKTYQPGLSVWQKERADYLINFLRRGEVIVDLGSGSGEILKYIKNKINIKGISVDINDLVLAEAKSNGLEVIKVDLLNREEWQLLPEGDYFVGFEILEHITNVEELLKFISNKTRHSLIFSVPNTGYYLHRLRLLFGKFPLQWINHPGEHVRFWTVSDIKWWVRSLGFELDNIKIYQGLPILNKIWPSLFGQGIIIKISKK